MAQDHIDTLRKLVAAKRGILMPGAANALSARIIADLGFEALYLTGAGLTNMHLGLPDYAFMDLTQLAEHTMAIRGITDLPLVVDADTGFGNALNVGRTVVTLERAGASAIQIEDQVMPKRCGHFDGQEVIPATEMVGKIKAAVDARRDGVLIVARTDARSAEGFEAAIERGHKYIEAGADILFVEAPKSADELRRIPQRLPTPHILNMVIGGKTPITDAKMAGEMGFHLVLYANVALQGAIKGMQAALGALRERGAVDEALGLTATFAERQRLVGKPHFDTLSKRYATQ
ncbi:carboxyvinyl-carboxyphosphonate phosphorylmutase [Pseudolabrys taiwanensis]|uniref:Carboxyvinyl-carboxyphosphonate phosphorylmutase n=1 Tax=Pseudolabrys taiwanensis TaxID=331696 RepID=A0A345ZQ97_9HYPH|nr:isocitrate lyase/PEP mutase family protein [Pseudolabrys taiwanensis]AXK79094.1 carboxyvinyl-carboxyphosphonate phosphorylmutase [Pseudolabrys taiwanensis]